MSDKIDNGAPAGELSITMSDGSILTPDAEEIQVVERAIPPELVQQKGEACFEAFMAPHRERIREAGAKGPELEYMERFMEECFRAGFVSGMESFFELQHDLVMSTIGRIGGKAGGSA